jgi:hypothetical protein
MRKPEHSNPDVVAFTDHDLDEVNPIVTPLPFIEMSNGRDLLERFQKILTDLKGPDAIAEKRPPPGPEDDILEQVPKKVRRLSL